MKINELASRIISDDYRLSREEALELAGAPLAELKESARAITAAFSGDRIELCSITNGKCGLCSEDCKFCSQSRFYSTHVTPKPLKDREALFERAKYDAERGVHRFSVVTAGAALSHAEVLRLAETYSYFREHLSIGRCGSLGLLRYEDFVILRDHGLTRFHNNIETSPAFFRKICSTHSQEQKLRCIKNARRAGLEICSGCIIGMGESRGDRVDIALTLREIGAVSTPINVLNPIKGTPLENQEPLEPDEIRRTVAVFRHVLPRTVLRLAGGRSRISDFYTDLFDYGINAVMTSDMLTTSGFTIASDISSIIETGHRSAAIDPS